MAIQHTHKHTRNTYLSKHTHVGRQRRRTVGSPTAAALVAGRPHAHPIQVHALFKVAQFCWSSSLAVGRGHNGKMLCRCCCIHSGHTNTNVNPIFRSWVPVMQLHQNLYDSWAAIEEQRILCSPTEISHTLSLSPSAKSLFFTSSQDVDTGRNLGRGEITTTFTYACLTPGLHS